MKKKIWETPNKMKFESLHKTFNKQCMLIITGNQIGNVVYSNYVRSYYETESNGHTFPEGHLQNYDLTENVVGDVLPSDIREEIRELTRNDGGIVYHFHHWNGDKRIDDGIVLTSNDCKLRRRHS